MLGWSINLFRVFGIQLSVHGSFLLLLAYYGYEGWREGGMVGAGWSLLLIVLFFVCVVLHELGHSLTAQRFGVKIPRILLLPIGGMAEFDRIPQKPSQELLITIAGPAVNFVLTLFFLPFVFGHFWHSVENPTHTLAGLGVQLFVANLIMGTFNLLPVFPMDGGRIFRALLATKLPYLRATLWAMRVGKVLALCFAALAFYFKIPMVGLLFLFIFWVGGTEYKQVLRREEEASYWAERAIQLRAVSMSPEEPPAPPMIIRGPN